jgi:oxygen-dependent protoporphyrinogen oxidase
MLGGHWWDGFDTYPDEEEGAAMARAVLKRHLQIDKEPELINVGLQRECIPQYTVGHQSRLSSAHTELMDAFKGKLAVAGNTYAGVGLNDCIRSARDVVKGIKSTMGTTGLENANQDIWVTVRKAPAKNQDLR